MNLVLLPLTVQDIAEATEYLDRADAHAVVLFRQAIAKSLRLLVANSRIGRHSRSQGVREWSVSNWPYVLPYRVVGEEVQILRVWHTRPNLPANWRGYENPPARVFSSGKYSTFCFNALTECNSALPDCIP